MRSISNGDFVKVVRLLKSFTKTKGDTSREVNERRMASLLLRKFERMANKAVPATRAISYSEKKR